jgi:hypothetical protein
MTVQELIAELEKVANKSLPVFTTWRDTDDEVLRVEVENDRVQIVPKSLYINDAGHTKFTCAGPSASA